jgi:hypothetical protein
MLKYSGDGFLVGVPARDLTDEEVKAAGGEKRLLASGLYVKPEAPKEPKAQRAPKAPKATPTERAAAPIAPTEKVNKSESGEEGEQP